VTTILAHSSEPTRRAVAELPLRTEADVASARVTARALGRDLGLSDAVATRFATAVSEVSRNAVVHAGGGTVAFSLDVRGRAGTLIASVTDDGPGIADVEAAITPRLDDPTGTGVGLSRARRLVDDLRIRQRDGGGTVVEIVRSVPAGAAARWDAALAAIGTTDRNGPARHVATGADDGATGLFGSPARATPTSDLEAELERLRADRDRLAVELQETNRGVVALYAELEDQAERLRRADELKSRFLSRVSHELRTPINSIVALSRLLADRVDGDLTEGQATQVGYIQAAGSELSDLVNDLLDLARIESGRIEVVRREFLLESVLASLRGMLRPLAKPGVELHVDVPDGIPAMDTDEGKLTQIVRNFVANALKFTDRGSVTIRAAKAATPDRVRIEVEDTGIGIDAPDLDRIFEEFVQVPGAHQVGVAGTGLGLSVARGLAALLGGEVGAASVPGSGSTFWVELPTAYEPRSDTPPTRPAAGASPTVLVVDDDPTARYLVRHQLAPQGVRLLEAATGADGVELARRDRADVVVLDLTMPDLDGLDVLARLRAIAGLEATPVIVHTGRRLTDDERGTIERAGARVLLKDAAPGAIAAAVHAAVTGPDGTPEEPQPEAAR
jgi:signal transduction histidine kinase/ActR/RegA family two-component response regulator